MKKLIFTAILAATLTGQVYAGPGPGGSIEQPCEHWMPGVVQHSMLPGRCPMNLVVRYGAYCADNNATPPPAQTTAKMYVNVPRTLASRLLGRNPLLIQTVGIFFHVSGWVTRQNARATRVSASDNLPQLPADREWVVGTELGGLGLAGGAISIIEGVDYCLEPPSSSKE